MPIATVTQLEAKSHDTPDETRTPPKTRIEQISLGGYTLGRFTFEPGWRWSECIKPIVGTDSCQLSHVGYVISGSLSVETSDGKHVDLEAGQSIYHPAWPRRLERRRRALDWARGSQRRRIREALTGTMG
jgi:hypothetical protein